MGDDEGGSFRTRHNDFGAAIEELSRWVGSTVSCTAEVYGLFAHLISQVALDAVQGAPGQAKTQHRKRQAVVPDFRFRGKVNGLAELKRIGCCPSHYPGSVLGGVRPVEKRASAIQGEYEAKMRKMDGVADRGLHHPRERLMTEFRKYGAIKGLVVGAFGEFSNDLKALMSSFVDAKVPGDPKDFKAARGWAWNKVRTTLGVVAVRTNARLKLDGLRWCGPGGKEAYGRRKERQKTADIGRSVMRALYNVSHSVVHTGAVLGPRC